MANNLNWSNSLQLDGEHTRNNEFIRSTVESIKGMEAKQGLVSNKSANLVKRNHEGISADLINDTKSTTSIVDLNSRSHTKLLDASTISHNRRMSSSPTCPAIVRPNNGTITAGSYQNSNIYNTDVEAAKLIESTSETGKFAIKSENLSPSSKMLESPLLTTPNNHDDDRLKDSRFKNSSYRHSQNNELIKFKQPSDESLAAHMLLYQNIPEASESFADLPSSISFLQQTNKDVKFKPSAATCQSIKPSEDDSLRLARLLATSEFGLRRRI